MSEFTRSRNLFNALTQLVHGGYDVVLPKSAGLMIDKPGIGSRASYSRNARRVVSVIYDPTQFLQDSYGRIKWHEVMSKDYRFCNVEFISLTPLVDDAKRWADNLTTSQFHASNRVVPNGYGLALMLENMQIWEDQLPETMIECCADRFVDNFKNIYTEMENPWILHNDEFGLDVNQVDFSGTMTLNCYSNILDSASDYAYWQNKPACANGFVVNIAPTNQIEPEPIYIGINEILIKVPPMTGRSKSTVTCLVIADCGEHIDVFYQVCVLKKKISSNYYIKTIRKRHQLCDTKHNVRVDIKRLVDFRAAQCMHEIGKNRRRPRKVIDHDFVISEDPIDALGDLKHGNNMETLLEDSLEETKVDRDKPSFDHCLPEYLTRTPCDPENVETPEAEEEFLSDSNSLLIKALQYVVPEAPPHIVPQLLESVRTSVLNFYSSGRLSRHVTKAILEFMADYVEISKLNHLRFLYQIDQLESEVSNSSRWLYDVYCHKKKSYITHVPTQIEHSCVSFNDRSDGLGKVQSKKNTMIDESRFKTCDESESPCDDMIPQKDFELPGSKQKSPASHRIDVGPPVKRVDILSAPYYCDARERKYNRHTSPRNKLHAHTLKAQTLSMGTPVNQFPNVPFDGETAGVSNTLGDIQREVKAPSEPPDAQGINSLLVLPPGFVALPPDPITNIIRICTVQEADELEGSDNQNSESEAFEDAHSVSSDVTDASVTDKPSSRHHRRKPAKACGEPVPPPVPDKIECSANCLYYKASNEKYLVFRTDRGPDTHYCPLQTHQLVRLYVDRDALKDRDCTKSFALFDQSSPDAILHRRYWHPDNLGCTVLILESRVADFKAKFRCVECSADGSPLDAEPRKIQDDTARSSSGLIEIPSEHINNNSDNFPRLVPTPTAFAGHYNTSKQNIWGNTRSQL